MTTWEYRVETTDLKKMTAEWLNKLGSDGWELVGITALSGMYGASSNGQLIFKRPS